jgi:hypothetical protein
MGVPTSEVGYTSATIGRGDHEVHKGHVVALEEKKPISALITEPSSDSYYEYVTHNCVLETQLCVT